MDQFPFRHSWVFPRLLGKVDNRSDNVDHQKIIPAYGKISIPMGKSVSRRQGSLNITHPIYSLVFPFVIYLPCLSNIGISEFKIGKWSTRVLCLEGKHTVLCTGKLKSKCKNYDIYLEMFGSDRIGGCLKWFFRNQIVDCCRYSKDWEMEESRFSKWQT